MCIQIVAKKSSPSTSQLFTGKMLSSKATGSCTFHSQVCDQSISVRVVTQTKVPVAGAPGDSPVITMMMLYCKYNGSRPIKLTMATHPFLKYDMATGAFLKFDTATGAFLEI